MEIFEWTEQTPVTANNMNEMQSTLLGNVKDDLTDDTKIPSVKAIKNTYSETETVIGTWIDGKPLYRKVITSTLTSTITHGIANINEIVNLKAVSYNPNSGKYFVVPSVRPSNSNYEVGLFADASTISLEYRSELPTTMTFKIIMEYTKTTDV